MSVVGTRPELVQAEPFIRALGDRNESVLVHTGQHYDPNMSEMILRSLGLRKPDYSLRVGPGSHAYQTAKIMERLDPLIVDGQANCVVVYGDTNSSLAGALTAAKAGIPVAHVEAGLRSWNRGMPEELNRVIVDHVADFLFCPTRRAVRNLRAEGIHRGVYQVGDVMYDSALFWKRKAQARKTAARFSLRPKTYLLLTLHRPANVDDPARLARILRVVGELDRVVLFPLHPRTRARLRRGAGRVHVPQNVRVVDPLNYLDFLSALMDAEKVLTDSGGVQKQAYFFAIPCLTLRTETEWLETVESGWNVIVGTKLALISKAVDAPRPPHRGPAFYGNGRAAQKIVGILERRL